MENEQMSSDEATEQAIDTYISKPSMPELVPDVWVEVPKTPNDSGWKKDLMRKRRLERKKPHGNEKDDSPECIHHERIDEPNGPTSIGTCIKCGHQKIYNNHLSDDMITNTEHRVYRESYDEI